jgi:Holliday junction resolvasome RuvABC endonuclease subunit
VITLGVDPGIAAVGWSVVDERARVLDLGVVVTKRDASIPKSTDRSRRILDITEALLDEIGRHGPARIAAEQPLGHGTTNAVVPQALLWGVLIEIARSRNLELVEVAAKSWQHAVIPATGRKAVPYPKVARELERLAGSRLFAVRKGLRTHALDAIGVAAFAALLPGARRIT